jgi:hypothetical protein
MRRVVVHIDRLVLDGFRPEDCHGVGEGLNAELRRLLAAAPIGERIASLRSVSNVDAGRIAVERGAKPQATGVATASAIAKELGR